MIKTFSSFTKKLLISPVFKVEVPNRTTFILKRAYPVFLHKKNKSPRILKAKDYIYELVEDTDSKPKPDLDLLLIQHVDGIGRKGDRVKMKPYSGYTNLLLPGLAVYATPENLEYYHSILAEEDNFSSKYVKRTMSVLSNQVLAITMNKDIPWTIEPWHVRACFRKAGFYVSEDAIKLPEKPITGPSPDVQDKTFITVVTINNKEQVKVRCRIHLWTSDQKNKTPYIKDHWILPADAYFEEERELLKSMTPPIIKKKKTLSDFK